MQSSLLLALLALSTLWQSSETGLGKEGRDRALTIRSEAQAALEASFNARWIDETLAQAAWVLALFEACAHPKHSSERRGSAMAMLDSIVRSLSLTSVDADDRDTCVFSPRTVPHVPSDSQSSQWSTSSSASTSFVVPGSSTTSERDGSPASSTMGCVCKSLSLAAQWPGAMEYAPQWASTAGWSGESEAEIRKESCRRLCWSSMVLATDYVTYMTTRGAHPVDLHLSDPANYALLFDGQSIARSELASRSGSSGKGARDTVWALYNHSALLWHSCMRMRHDPVMSDTEKAQFAKNAWLEAEAIEESLAKHNCDVEKMSFYQGREYLFNTRMCITYESPRFIPYPLNEVNSLFTHAKAEEWLRHQTTVVRRFMYDLSLTKNEQPTQKPFSVFWFMGQLSRALTLWECDNSLMTALDVCKSFLPPIDYLTALWPCTEQRNRYDDLRDRLSHACMLAGASNLPPLNLALSQFPSTAVI